MNAETEEIINQVRTQKDKLEKEKELKTIELRKYVKENLETFLKVLNFDLSEFDEKKCLNLKDGISKRINQIENYYEKKTKNVFKEFVDIINKNISKFENEIKILFLINSLKNKFEKGSISDGQMMAEIDLNNLICKFYDGNDELSHFKGENIEWKPENAFEQIIFDKNVFEKMFQIRFKFQELKNFVIHKKLSYLLGIIRPMILKELDVDEIVINDIIKDFFTEFNAVLMKFNINHKKKALVLSFILSLFHGLIPFADYEYFINKKEYYYLVWTEQFRSAD